MRTVEGMVALERKGVEGMFRMWSVVKRGFMGMSPFEYEYLSGQEDHIDMILEGFTDMVKVETMMYEKG